MTCTSSYRTPQTTHRVIGAAMPLEPRRSKASSHQQQHFFLLVLPTTGADSQTALQQQHPWTPQLPETSTYTKIGCTWLGFCLQSPHKKVSMLLEFTQSFPGHAGSWGGGTCFTSRTELQNDVLKLAGGWSFKHHKVINPLALLSARPAFAASHLHCSEEMLLSPRVWPCSSHTRLWHLPTPTR